MDGSRFDCWTRRRLGLATGSLVTGLLTFGAAKQGAAKKKDKKGKKRCGKRKKRCQGQCIKRTQCCRDSDCPPESYCCRGDCVSLDSPCLDGGNYACFAEGELRQSVEGEVYCTRNSDLPVCAQCESSDGCLADERCFAAHCAEEVTAVCRRVYTEF